MRSFQAPAPLLIGYPAQANNEEDARKSAQHVSIAELNGQPLRFELRSERCIDGYCYLWAYHFDETGLPVLTYEYSGMRRYATYSKVREHGLITIPEPDPRAISWAARAGAYSDIRLSHDTPRLFGAVGIELLVPLNELSTWRLFASVELRLGRRRVDAEPGYEAYWFYAPTPSLGLLKDVDVGCGGRCSVGFQFGAAVGIPTSSTATVRIVGGSRVDAFVDALFRHQFFVEGAQGLNLRVGMEQDTRWNRPRQQIDRTPALRLGAEYWRYLY
jgi:hypothetical protein